MPQDDLEPPFLEQVDAQESSAGLSSTGSTPPPQPPKRVVIKEARWHLEQDWATVRTERSQTHQRKKNKLFASKAGQSVIASPNKVTEVPYPPAKA